MNRRGPGIPLDLARTKDGRAILSRADLEQYDHTPQRSGGRDRYFCPIHGGDHQRSLSVDPDTGKYKCHTCGEGGTLREHWPNADGKPVRPARALSIEEVGRRELAAQRRAEVERAARLGADLPAHATAFLTRMDAMSAALRAPDCPGAVYLRSRGLDPVRAMTLGVGYAPPNTWPGDRNRRQGRVVFPLADPATGRIVSAVGRLCIDPSPEWSAELRETFKGVKQRKLKDCPAGVWPYASIAAARERGCPLVLVEGPADALALSQLDGVVYPVLALLGTANVLTAASVRGLAGVVLALDDDDSGVKGAGKVRTDLALAGVRVQKPARGWLGGAKDPAELIACGNVDASVTAVAALMTACRCVGAAAWQTDRADSLIRGLYARLAEASADAPLPLPPFDDRELDVACAAYDWPALVAAVDAAERGYRTALRPADARDTAPPPDKRLVINLKAQYY